MLNIDTHINTTSEDKVDTMLNCATRINTTSDDKEDDHSNNNDDAKPPRLRILVLCLLHRLRRSVGEQ
jgi:hypothetical protein